MARKAKHIEVICDRNGYSLKIDDVEFPRFISNEPAIETSVSLGEHPQITLTILADRLTIDHGI